MDVGQWKCKRKPRSCDCVGPGEGKNFIFSVISEVTAVYAPNLVTEQKHCQKNIITWKAVYSPLKICELAKRQQLIIGRHGDSSVLCVDVSSQQPKHLYILSPLLGQWWFLGLGTWSWKLLSKFQLAFTGIHWRGDPSAPRRTGQCWQSVS